MFDINLLSDYTDIKISELLFNWLIYNKDKLNLKISNQKISMDNELALKQIEDVTLDEILKNPITIKRDPIANDVISLMEIGRNTRETTRFNLSDLSKMIYINSYEDPKKYYKWTLLYRILFFTSANVKITCELMPNQIIERQDNHYIEYFNNHNLKEEYINIKENLYKELVSFIETNGIGNNDYIFGNVSNTTLNKMLQRHANYCNIKKKISASEIKKCRREFLREKLDSKEDYGTDILTHDEISKLTSNELFNIDSQGLKWQIVYSLLYWNALRPRIIGELRPEQIIEKNNDNYLRYIHHITDEIIYSKLRQREYELLSEYIINNSIQSGSFIFESPKHRESSLSVSWINRKLKEHCVGLNLEKKPTALSIRNSRIIHLGIEGKSVEKILDLMGSDYSPEYLHVHKYRINQLFKKYGLR